MDNKKITIVTVCYNCKKNLMKTIKSVEMQKDLEFIEHCIIDGNSDDGTIEVVLEYKKNKDNVIFISEKDNGIYDAMNKAVKYCNGQYLIFLNAGDTFYDQNVIYKLKNAISNNEDIVYGNFMKVKDDVNFINKYSKYYYLKIFIGKTICHQAILAKKDMFENNLYDLNYKYAADYKWLLKCLIKNAKIKFIKEYICNYDMTGVSTTKKASDIMRIEYKQIIEECMGKKYCNILYKIKSIRRIFLR